MIVLMNYKIAQKLSPEQFKYRFGIHRDTFKHKRQSTQTAMEDQLQNLELNQNYRLQIVVVGCWFVLKKAQEYRTYFDIHLGVGRLFSQL